MSMKARENIKNKERDMKTVEKKQMSWGLFIIAFVFLFNPNIAIIDPLPDFLGYIILSVALTKLAMINEHLYDAKRAFDRMIIVDIGKIIAILWVFGMDAVSERNTSMLLWFAVPGVMIYQATTTEDYLRFMFRTDIGKYGLTFIVVALIGALWFINKKIAAPIE